MQNEVIYVKYEELFQLKDFQKAKLLTGDNILLRKITGAHVIEMADGVNWAGRGELVFTSGVGFHDVDHEMKVLIQTVAQNYAEEIYERAEAFGFDEKRKHIALFLSPDEKNGDLEHLMQAARQSLNLQPIIFTLIENNNW